MEEKFAHVEQRHEVVLTNREVVSVSGVVHVASFDSQEVVLDTDMGALTLRGEDFHIKQLNLDEGNLSIEGLLKSLEYQESGRTRGGRGKGKGFLEKLLR